MCESSWYLVAGGVDDERLVDVLQQALPRLTEPVPRALLFLLAIVGYYHDDPECRVILSGQALALARSTADTIALAHVLYLRVLVLFGPDYPEQCLSAASELLELPGLPQPLMVAARLGYAVSLATVGCVTEAATELELLVPSSDSQVFPLPRVHLGWARAGLLLLRGRWREADAISLAPEGA